MKRGDLLILAQGHYVPRGGRYQQGLILEANNNSLARTARIMWLDGKITVELMNNIRNYYEIVPYETG